MPISVGYDAAFGINEFGQAKIISEIEVIKNALLTVLFSKRGQFPSLPMIGMDIGNRLYNFYDEIRIDELQSELTQQCAALGVYIRNDTIQMIKKKYKGHPAMLIQVGGRETYPSGYLCDNLSNVKTYHIGITYDDLHNMLLDIK